MKAAVGKPRSLRNGARVLSRSHCRRAGRLQARGCRGKSGFGKWSALAPDDGSSVLWAFPDMRNCRIDRAFLARCCCSSSIFTGWRVMHGRRQHR